jgi:hypothetical protein
VRAETVDDRADPLVAIERRELLEHAQVRELHAKAEDFTERIALTATV